MFPGDAGQRIPGHAVQEADQIYVVARDALKEAVPVRNWTVCVRPDTCNLAHIIGGIAFSVSSNCQRLPAHVSHFDHAATYRRPCAWHSAKRSASASSLNVGGRSCRNWSSNSASSGCSSLFIAAQLSEMASRYGGDDRLHFRRWQWKLATGRIHAKHDVVEQHHVGEAGVH